MSENIFTSGGLKSEWELQIERNREKKRKRFAMERAKRREHYRKKKKPTIMYGYNTA